MTELLIQGILRGSVARADQILHGWIITIDNKILIPNGKPFIFKDRKSAVRVFYNEFHYKSKLYLAHYLNTGEINGLYTWSSGNQVRPWSDACKDAFKDFKRTLGNRLQFKEI